MSGFDYETAFDRNIGWVTRDEQLRLREKTIAIAGMGGVGGVHLLTLARLGIGGFHIADFDRFDFANFNRQVGATVSTVGLPKVEVMRRMALDINPEARIETFARGVTEENLDAFLDGVDLFVDGFDFFALDIRAKTFARCAELGIPAVTAAPIGLSTGYLTFMPGKMTFEEYFRLDGLSRNRQYVNFFLGLVPAALHRSYLVDPTRLNLAEKRGPSSPAGVQLCSGVVAAEAMKILLGRGRIEAAPHFHQFDAYTGKWISRRLRGGNDNALQRRKLAMAYRMFGALPYDDTSARPEGCDPDCAQMLDILDLARWAPSGDNAQPWRFDIRSPDTVRITIDSASIDANPYEYGQGQPTLIAVGGLLETLGIAASTAGATARYTAQPATEGPPDIDVAIDRDAAVAEDPLYRFLPVRSVDRRAYRKRAIPPAVREALIAAAGEDFRLDFYETPAQRRALARLNADATDIRLRIPEAFPVHQAIIDWRNDFSERGIPARTLPLDPATRAAMRWALGQWSRVEKLNRAPGGTTVAQLEMDVVPGRWSAAYFTLSAPADTMSTPATRLATLLACGAAFQRIWLTATANGLSMQPTFAPLCFAHHVRTGHPFTQDAAMREKAGLLAGTMSRTLHDAGNVLCMARIGYPRARTASRFTPRSIRRPLAKLVSHCPTAQ